MYVCLCNPVSDKQIAQAARDGACCVRDLRERLGVGTGCGKCVPTARAVLHAHMPSCDQACADRADEPRAALPRPAPVATVIVLAA